MTGFGSGSYTIKPSKAGGSNAAISSQDAARVAQGVTGVVPFVSQNQRFAADVTGNGLISSADAAQIARFVAGLSTTSITGQWKFFLPPGAPSPLPTPPQAYDDSRTYASVAGSVTGEDYVAILVGEVSGNWNPATHPRTAPRSGGEDAANGDMTANGPERSVVVEVQNIVAASDGDVVVPINVTGLADKDVISYEFDLLYDPSVIQPVGDIADLRGTASRRLSVVVNPNEPGVLRVVAYGPMPIDIDSVLLNLRFSAVGSAGSTSPLTVESIMFNEGDLRVLTLDGRVDLF